MMPMFSPLDIAILVVLAYGLVRGIFRGLSGELAGLLSVAAAGFAGWHLYAPMGRLLEDTTRMTPLQADTAAFFVVIVGALIILYVLSLLFKAVMELTFKGLFERVGGAVAGVTRYAVILAALLLVVDQFARGGVREYIEQDSWITRHALAYLGPWYQEALERYPEWTPFGLDARDEDAEWTTDGRIEDEVF